MKLKPLPSQVIVITGASSGVGLATARMAAERGAKVVMAARSVAVLEQAAREIEAAGGEALAVSADVASRAELEAVAARALERFGGFDTWVNNAGVGVWGKIEEVSEEDMRRLFETNFWGVVNGSLVALRHLKGKGGAIVNIGSLTSDRAFPIQGIYSASKQAVKGFTDALRMELEHDNAPISVTLIKPASMATPLAQHVKNYSDKEAYLPPPVYLPEEAAATILRAAEYPMRDAFIGSGARAVSMVDGVAPRLLDWISAKFVVPMQYGSEQATASDNLHQGKSEGQVHGEQTGRPSLYTRAARNPGAAFAAAGLAAAGIGAFLWGRRGARVERSTEAEVEAHPS